MKKIKKLNNSKGFSLIELIIAVTILGVIVVPLLSAFVTASNTSAKSQKLGEATDNATNILEALQSNDISGAVEPDGDVTALETNLKNILGISDLTVAKGTKENKDSGITIKNIKNGSFKFDAEVEITPGHKYDAQGNITSDGIIGSDGVVGDEYYNLNSKEITKSGNVSAIFTQPNGIMNPDVAVRYDTTEESELLTPALEAFEKECTGNINSKGDDNYYLKSYIHRVIKIDVNKYGSEVIAKISYFYSFAYQNGGMDPVTAAFEVPVDNLQGEIGSNGELPTFYIMYYPLNCGNNLSIGLNQGKGKSSEVTFVPQTDVIEVHYEDDADANIMLVKQWPLKELTDVSKIDKRENVSADEYIDVYNTGTKFLIKEYRNIDISQVWSYDDFGGKIYTNANKNLKTGESFILTDFHKLVVPDAEGLENEYDVGTEELDSQVKNSLTETMQDDRIFKITVKIYDDKGNYMFRLNGSTLKDRNATDEIVEPMS